VVFAMRRRDGQCAAKAANTLHGSDTALTSPVPGLSHGPLSPVGLSESGLLTTFFYGDRDPLRFPVDVCNRHRPERNKIDSRHELRNKRWQKLPMPAKKVDQRSSNSEVEYVIRRRLSSLDE
jgi:hypothetical protein